MLKTMLKLHFGTVMEEKEYWGLLSGLCYFLILSNNYHLRNRQKWNNIIIVLQHEVHDFVLVLFSFIHTLHSV